MTELYTGKRGTILASPLLRSVLRGYSLHVLTWLRKPSPGLEAQLAELRERLSSLERREAVRAGEWADVLDRFESLYRRFVARQDRALRAATGQGEPVATGDPSTGPAVTTGDSPLSLRQRLQRR